MTILFFSRRFYPLIGGVEKHVLEIGKRLVEKGYKVVVITENDSFPKQSEVEGIKVIKVIRISVGKEGFFKKFRIWKELFIYLREIKTADIIHCHDVFFWYLPFRLLFPFKKIYTTFHGYEGNNIPNQRAIFMHKISEKLSKGNICVGEFLKKWYGTKPSFLTYGAVEEAVIEKGSKNIKPNKDVMFLGRLENETGIMKYLEALRLLKDKGINLYMDVFGDGDLLEEARYYVKKNKLNVSFKGFVYNPEKHMSDYKYIFTSRYLGILESLASKRPVFAEYNNSIKKDYLTLTPFASFISIAKDSNEISSQLKDYIKEKQAIDLNKAYEWVKKQTWEKMVNTYLQLWNIK